MIRGDENQTDGESEWLAVRYVLGELSPGDAKAFEARLDDDQLARDSLVLATRLVTALAATPAVTVPRRPSPVESRPLVESRQKLCREGRGSGIRDRRLSFSRYCRMAPGRAAAVLAAAAAAVVVGLLLYRGDESDARRLLVSEEVDPARLVVLWSASGDLLNGGAGEGDDAAGADSDAALLPPDWMLAAVEQEAILSPLESPLDPDGDEIERN